MSFHDFIAHAVSEVLEYTGRSSDMPNCTTRQFVHPVEGGQFSGTLLVPNGVPFNSTYRELVYALTEEAYPRLFAGMEPAPHVRTRARKSASFLMGSEKFALTLKTTVFGLTDQARLEKTLDAFVLRYVSEAQHYIAIAHPTLSLAAATTTSRPSGHVPTLVPYATP